MRHITTVTRKPAQALVVGCGLLKDFLGKCRLDEL
jgi:hypothetical protein